MSNSPLSQETRRELYDALWDAHVALNSATHFAHDEYQSDLMVKLKKIDNELREVISLWDATQRAQAQDVMP